MPNFKNDPVVSVTDNNRTPAVQGVSSTLEGIGVYGESAEFNGVHGKTTSNGHAGVAGVSEIGVGNGVYGHSQNGDGVAGYSAGTGHSGVAGVNEEGNGTGVYGRSTHAAGVYGESTEFDGVLGVSKANGHSGVAGVNDVGDGNGVYAHSQKGVGVFAIGGRLAGYFEGDVEVTGDIRLTNADCAEDFDISGAENIEPGTVMVLCEEGALQPSEHAYDKRVAGVIFRRGRLQTWYCVG